MDRCTAFLCRSSFRAEPAEEATLYERCAAPVGVAMQTESEKHSFSSTPAAAPAGAFRSATERSEALSAEMRFLFSFSQHEKKKRGLQTVVLPAQRAKNFSR